MKILTIIGCIFLLNIGDAKHVGTLNVAEYPCNSIVVSTYANHTTQIDYDKTDDCMPENIELNCLGYDDSFKYTSAIINDTFEISWAQKNIVYKCTAFLKDEEERISENFKFYFELNEDEEIIVRENEADLIIRLDKSNEIGVRMSYDGDIEYDSFKIKQYIGSEIVNVFEVTSGFEVVITNVVPCQRYAFVLFGFSEDLPSLLVRQDGVAALPDVPMIKTLSSGYFMMDVEVGLQYNSKCEPIEGVFQCAGVPDTKYEFRDNSYATFKLLNLASNQNYTCMTTVTYIDGTNMSSINYSLFTQKAITIENEGGNDIIITISDDVDFPYDTYELLVDNATHFIEANKGLMLHDFEACNSYNVQLFGLMYIKSTSKTFLGEEMFETKANVPNVSALSIGYFKSVLEVRLPIDTFCTVDRAELNCGDDVALIGIKFNVGNVAVVNINNLQPNQQYECYANIAYDEYGHTQSQPYIFTTRKALMVESKTPTELIIKFECDNDNYQKFLIEIDDEKYDAQPGTDLVISDKNSCQKYVVVLYGLLDDGEVVKLDTQDIIIIADEPKIDVVTEGFFKYELEVKYPTESRCEIKEASLHCNHLEDPQVLYFFDTVARVSIPEILPNERYECQAEILFEDDQLIESDLFRFNTAKALIAESKTPNEISVKFSYDGDRLFSNFYIYLDEMSLPIIQDEELVIKDLEADKEYKLELFGKSDEQQSDMYLTQTNVKVISGRRRPRICSMKIKELKEISYEFKLE